MSDPVFVAIIICVTVLILAGGGAIMSALKECGVFALKRTAKSIEAEKLKAQNKELLEGKYI